MIINPNMAHMVYIIQSASVNVIYHHPPPTYYARNADMIQFFTNLPIHLYMSIIETYKKFLNLRKNKRHHQGVVYSSSSLIYLI